jgi:predicted ATPase
MLARRPDAARLLILGTYRPADVAVGAHPLKPVKQELQMHGRCEELALAFLSEAAVGEYLSGRFPRASLPPDFTRQLHENTGGNPLFLVNVVDDVIAQGHLREVDGEWRLAVPVERVAAGVPDTLWQMVEKQVERLAPLEQAVLAIGSVAGAEFSAALATVDGIEARDAERCCDALARRGQFLRATGAAEWADGTVAGRYGFIHALYRNVLYARISIGHRVGLHLRIGDRLERAYGARADDVAGELAMHFEHGRDFERAVQYRRRAADGALRQHGYREAVTHATRALELLATVPESPERNGQELPIQTMLGAAVIATSGWAAPEVGRAYGRARELCAQTAVTPQRFPVLLGLHGFYLMRGELGVAEEVSRQLLVQAEATGDAAELLGAHNTAGLVAFYRGGFAPALVHLERSKTIYDPERHRPNRLFSLDHDPRVSYEAHIALAHMMLGYPDRAATETRDCLAYAHAIDHPLSVALAVNFAAILHQFRRERHVVQELEDVRLEYSTKHDFDMFRLLGEVYRGWLVAEAGHGEDGLAQIRQGLGMYQAIGAELGRPTFLGVLAEVCAELGRTEEGLAAVDEALALGEATGMHAWDAELHRRRGELLLQRDESARRPSAARDAEACFLAAIEIARRQQTKSFELRAAMSLSRLWRRLERASQAHTRLAEIYRWFSEGFGTPDLTDAKALLEDLGGDVGRRR